MPKNQTLEGVEKPVEVTGVEARQATGPPVMLTVLVVSLLLAAAAGLVLLAYFLS